MALPVAAAEPLEEDGRLPPASVCPWTICRDLRETALTEAAGNGPVAPAGRVLTLGSSLAARQRW